MEYLIKDRENEFNLAKQTFDFAAKRYFDRLIYIAQLKPYRGKFVKSEFGLQEVLVNINEPDTPEEIELKKIIAELEEKYLGKFIKA